MLPSRALVKDRRKVLGFMREQGVEISFWCGTAEIAIYPIANGIEVRQRFTRSHSQSGPLVVSCGSLFARWAGRVFSGSPTRKLEQGETLYGG